MENILLKYLYLICSGEQRRTTVFKSCIYASILLLPNIGHVEDNKQQLKLVQQNILAKEKNIQKQQEQRRALLSQLKEQEQSIAKLTRTLQNTQHNLKILNAHIDKLTHSIEQLQDYQITQQKLLAQQLDAAFRQGQYSGLQLILNNEETIRGNRILAYFRYLNETRIKTINNLRQIKTELAIQKSKQQQKQQQQLQVLQYQQKQQRTLQKVQAAREKTLSDLNSSIAENKQRLVELHQNEAHLYDTIIRAQQIAKTYTEWNAHKTQLVHKQKEQAKNHSNNYKPAENKQTLIARTKGLGQPTGQDLWPVKGQTIHRFGELQQGELCYKGLIIAAPEGSEVKAIASGRVLMADWLQGYGLMVVIEHGNGDMSLYGYNQSALVNVGDQVKAGHPIALVGASGGQDIPSLYFEIRRQGQAVNPLPWLGRYFVD